MPVCRLPNCNKEIPDWRVNLGYKSCCKRCSNAWNYLPIKQREEITGKKYKYKRK